ncbi:MAG: Ig-like domain repeat protein [Acidobacteriota bacterium]|nr:Ig-like domain repeat protein [Acidobacteriota bacterium]
MFSRVRTILVRACAQALLPALLLADHSSLQAQRIPIHSRIVSPYAPVTTGATPVDAGQLPLSQPMAVTLHLALPADRVAALDQLLTDQTDATSSNYHKWLTPQEFAASYGATDAQIAALTAWAQAQGLAVAAVSAGKTRLTLSGTAGQIQQAFAVSLHQYQIAGVLHFGAATKPSLPQLMAPYVASITGLDNLPSPVTAQIVASTLAGSTSTLSGSDAFSAAANSVDANTAATLSFTTSACSTDLTQAEIAAYETLFRQANAQGISVLATSGCSTGSFPASLPEVTSVTVSPGTQNFTAIAARPVWQVAVGLPADGNRYEPDLTVSSMSAFSQAIAQIQQNASGRIGNVNARLYQLATTPGLYTQPDNAAPGTWESSTGLGTVSLPLLIKSFPRATSLISTTTSLNSSSYAVNYGQAFTLTATIQPSSTGTASPTGTVTFSSATQGVLGTATLSGGTATFTSSTALNVGTYNLVATYSGDSNYAGSSSSSNSNVVVTVSSVSATITATISPTTNVPYGSTATVTATVSLPNANASPTGVVTASIQGIAGATYNGTLSPNPGGNTATTNIAVSAPPPSASSYQVQVTCASTTNYQCQTPALVNFTTTKGNTLTSVSATPTAPQAGSPVTLTATIANNGNGVGPYSFTGNVTFYSNGKLLGTAAVGSNQASYVATLPGNVSQNIIAIYTGDVDWNTSTSAAVVVTPTLLPSSLTLTTNTSTTLSGVNVVFTASVYTTVSNAVGPTGTVSFYDTFNGSVVLLGTSPLVSNGPAAGIAKLTTTGLLDGSHSVYAMYSGDGYFAAAISSTVAETITDFTLTMVPQTLTLKAGQNGQVVMLVGLVGGFTGSVSFGCTPPPSSEATCSFSPVTVNGSGSTTMTITTTAPVVSALKRGTQSAQSHSPWRALGGPALAALLCLLLPMRRRRLPVLLAMCLAVALLPISGCGLGGTLNSTPGSGGSTGTVTDPGTPSGTQSFTIVAAGSDGTNTVRHTYQYQVTVQ